MIDATNPQDEIPHGRGVPCSSSSTPAPDQTEPPEWCPNQGEPRVLEPAAALRLPGTSPEAVPAARGAQTEPPPRQPQPMKGAKLADGSRPVAASDSATTAAGVDSRGGNGPPPPSRPTRDVSAEADSSSNQFDAAADDSRRSRVAPPVDSEHPPTLSGIDPPDSAGAGAAVFHELPQGRKPHAIMYDEHGNATPLWFNSEPCPFMPAVHDPRDLDYEADARRVLGWR